MKRNILKGMVLIGAIALSSCSTQNKLASTQNDANDDVYSTKAVAGEQPVYAVRQDTYRQDNDANNNNYNNNYNDDDYYYYDSYSARLNRFYNDSPFLSSYYEDLYYGQYNPYYSSFGLGVGLGYGYYGGGYFGYNPFSYYGGFGYGNYGYYGSTIGYGYSPYWGAVSYYNVARTYNNNNARPYRGTGFPTGVGRNGAIGYANNGGRVTQSYNPGGRPSGVVNNSGRSTTSYSGRPLRPTTVSNNQPQQQQPQQRPQSQPQPQPQPSYNPPASSGSSGGSSGGGGGERSNGSSRPGRP